MDSKEKRAHRRMAEQQNLKLLIPYELELTRWSQLSRLILIPGFPMDFNSREKYPDS